ncbi:MAG: 16S rRNA (cytosine(1402)-N(4))-methyltransferase RsmH [Bacteroidales bacterium]|nr:16S rRNA (cytosine(1402)-N(4))-methyltransferase RsmH [Bacteroidales bacterium]
MSEYHNPVLLNESVDYLIAGNPDGVFADATFGGGGHSSHIVSQLSPEGRLIAFDKDQDAIENAFKDHRLTLIRNNFRFIHNFILEQGYEEGIDGVLADLGVSSHQFDTPERGFSFRFDAPLDMRMNTRAGKTAADIVNSYDEQDLEKILRVYGEVDGSRKAASLIVRMRNQRSILTTGDLKEAVQPLLPPMMEHKVLAKIFQALRIEVNNEMRDLEKFLQGAAASLKKGGRLVVITYHSLEDRMVKNFIKCGNIEGVVVKDLYGRTSAPLKAVNKKPIEPSDSEIATNTRARSAKLRVAEKL